MKIYNTARTDGRASSTHTTTYHPTQSTVAQCSCSLSASWIGISCSSVSDSVPVTRRLGSQPGNTVCGRGGGAEDENKKKERGKEGKRGSETEISASVADVDSAKKKEDGSEC
jgi:hypothetical protein